MTSEYMKNAQKQAREHIKELLGQCTEKQRDLFNRIYPMGIDKMPDDKIDWAISQCERTIKKNLEVYGENFSKIIQAETMKIAIDKFLETDSSEQIVMVIDVFYREHPREDSCYEEGEVR